MVTLVLALIMLQEKLLVQPLQKQLTDAQTQTQSQLALAQAETQSQLAQMETQLAQTQSQLTDGQMQTQTQLTLILATLKEVPGLVGNVERLDKEVDIVMNKLTLQ